MDNITHLVPSLKLSHVHIKDWRKVEEKVRAIISGKKDNLQVIADFDFTLTKFHAEGKRMLSTYGVVENYSNWSQQNKEAIGLLKFKYYQIDNDSTKTVKEKTPLLMSILKDALKIMELSSLQEEDFFMMVEENPIQLRDGTLDFFEDLNQATIPFLIISAGLGNIILPVLGRNGLLKPNVKVLANHVACNSSSEGKVSNDFGNYQLIHPYNKDDISYKLSDTYFKDFSQYNNVILMGDSMGDLSMSHGVLSPNTILTVGFLNEQIEECLESYKEKYDIVLVDDQTMTIPNSLVRLTMA